MELKGFKELDKILEEIKVKAPIYWKIFNATSWRFEKGC